MRSGVVVFAWRAALFCCIEVVCRGGMCNVLWESAGVHAVVQCDGCGGTLDTSWCDRASDGSGYVGMLLRSSHDGGEGAVGRLQKTRFSRITSQKHTTKVL